MSTVSDSHDNEATSPKRRFPLLLRSAWFGLNQSFRARLKPHGLTPDQFTVLRWLYEKKDECVRQSDLAQLMSSDNNTITSIITRMEKSQWVKRKPHIKDNRANQLMIMDAGEVLYFKGQAEAYALEEEVMGTLTDAERLMYLELMEKVAGACLVSREARHTETSRE